MLKICNVSKQYGGGGSLRYALRNVSLSVAPGEIVAVIGPNGAGKSSLGNVLVQDTPTEGAILLDGVDVTRCPMYERSGLFARLTQDPSASLSDAISISEHFALANSRGRRRSPWFGVSAKVRQEARTRLAALRCGLEGRLDDLVTRLSGGERQLVALSLLTISPPKALILDEPTSALDLSAKVSLRKTALGLIRKHSLRAIWITHDLDEALEVASCLIFMAAGRVIYSFSGDSLARMTREHAARLLSELIMGALVHSRPNFIPLPEVAQVM